MKRLLTFLFIIIAFQYTFSQVAIKLEGGIGPTFGYKDRYVRSGSYGHWELYKGSTLNGDISLLTEIAVSRSHPFLIETGLLVGISENAYDENSYVSDDTFLRIPIKFDYRLKLSEKTSLLFGIGPALNWEFGSYEGKKGNFQIGLNPSVSFRYRKFSVGISYYNPLFYNGSGNMNKNLFTLNLGLTFNLNPHWGGWGVIGTVANVVSEFGNTYYENSQNLNSEDYVSDSTKTSTSTKAVPQRGDGHKIKLEGQEFLRSSHEYWDYANRLSEMKTFPDRYSDSKRKEYQRKMKEIRKKHKDIKYSEWEDWDGK